MNYKEIRKIITDVCEGNHVFIDSDVNFIFASLWKAELYDRIKLTIEQSKEIPDEYKQVIFIKLGMIGWSNEDHTSKRK